MKKLNLKLSKLILTAIVTGFTMISSSVTAHDRLPWPDGRRVNVIHGTDQVDLSPLKSGVKGKVIDRRFVTNDAMYLANEMYLSGTEFFLRASEKGLPIANDPLLSYIANVEAYWYSRYNLGGLTIRSRNGIGVIHGPYIDLAAKKSSTLNRFGRGRGEMNFSNKDIMLAKTLDSFLTRTGMPHKFDNAVPLMLEFKSALPSLLGEVDVSLSPATGRSVYKDDFAGLQWSQDNMDTTIDMGGVAQAMLKKILWAKFFLRRNHTDNDFPGEIFIGQNAEDGLRGAMLTLESVSTMLMLKSALFATKKTSWLGFSGSEYQLTGINPFNYKSDSGLRFIPHEIKPQLVFMGDMPVRHYDMDISDASSQLWDQASWLWATTEYFDFSNPRKHDSWDGIFGYQSPFDGTIMEKKYGLLAQGLANMVLDNMQAMHLVDAKLVSNWQRGEALGGVKIKDLALSIVALKRYIETIDLEPGRVEQAHALLQQQAEYLLSAQNRQGAFPEDIGSEQATMNATSIAFGIRALLAAYDVTHNSALLDAARKASQLLNSEYWDDNAWLFRNKPENNHVRYTPVDIAAILAALREMTLADSDTQLLDHYKKFFVQAVDASGMQQAETTYTGENINKIRQGETDSDHDGIPFLGTKVDGIKVASVFAHQVEFDLTNFTHQQHLETRTSMAALTGRDIFAQNCAICHGENGVGNEGPGLIDNPYVQHSSESAARSTVEFGRTAAGMPAWGKSLSEQQLNAVVKYIRGLK